MTHIDFNAALGESPDLPTPDRIPAPATRPVAPARMDYKTLLQAAKHDLSRYDAQIDRMMIEADGLEVRDDVTNTTAVEMGGQVKKLLKALESDRKRIIDEPDGFVRSVNALARGIKDKLSRIESGIKSKIGDYQNRLEMERRKAEAEARRAAAEAQKRIDAEAKKAGVEPVTLDVPVVPPQQTATRTAEGTAYQQKFWTHEIEDISKLPPEYLLPNEQAIRAAVKNGVRVIPGVRIFESSRTVIRS